MSWVHRRGLLGAWLAGLTIIKRAQAAPAAAPVRGVDHVGLAVRDIEAATGFLRAALGAEVLYDNLLADGPSREGPDLERHLGYAEGSRVTAIRMLRLSNGPGIELFQVTAPDQHMPARASDLGWQHIAIYADDLNAALRRFGEAGGTLLSEPRPLPTKEAGKGNRFCYAQAPFGALFEFISYPSPQPYTRETPLRRWTPPASV